MEGYNAKFFDRWTNLTVVTDTFSELWTEMAFVTWPEKKSQRIEWECWEKKCYVGDPVSISLNGSVHGPESGENIPQHFSIAVDDIGWNEKDRKSWPSKTKKNSVSDRCWASPRNFDQFSPELGDGKKKVHSAFLSDFDQKYTQIIVGVLFTFLPLSHPAGSSREGN